MNICVYCVLEKICTYKIVIIHDYLFEFSLKYTRFCDTPLLQRQRYH